MTTRRPGPGSYDYQFSGKSLRDEQERIQKKTFTNWMNTYLCQLEPPLKIKDLFHDIKDGTLLIFLLEVLSGETLPKENRKTMQRVHFLTNIRTALEFLEKKSIKLVNINPTDIVDGKPAIVLGLIWTIILYFQIEEQEDYLLEALGMNGNTEKVKGAGRKALLAWVDKHLSGKYGVEVSDFGASWRDGRAFNAMVHNIDPSLVDMDKLQERTNRQNLEHAFDIAEKHLGVPRILDAEDVDVDKPDEKSIMTYVTQFLKKYPEGSKNANNPKERRASRVQESEPFLMSSKEAVQMASIQEPEEMEADAQRHQFATLENFLQKMDSTMPRGEEPVNDLLQEFQKFKELEKEYAQLNPVMEELLKKQAEGQLIGVFEEELEDLRKAWQHAKDDLNQWKRKIDLSIPGELGVVSVWIGEAETTLYSPWPENNDVHEFATAMTNRLQLHKKVFASSEQMREKFEAAKSQQPETVSQLHLYDLQQRLDKVYREEPEFYRKLDFAENQYRLQSTLLQLQEKLDEFGGAKHGDAALVESQLNDFNNTIKQPKLVESSKKMLAQFQRKANTFMRKDIAADAKACESVVLFLADMRARVEDVETRAPHVEAALKDMNDHWQTWLHGSDEIQKWLDNVEELLNNAQEEPVPDEVNQTKEPMLHQLGQLEATVQYLLQHSEPDVARALEKAYEDLKERFQMTDVELDEVIVAQKSKAQQARAQKEKERERLEREKREEEERLAEEERRKAEEEEKRLAEEEKKRQEEEERRKAEEEEKARKAAEDAARRKAEAEAQKQILLENQVPLSQWMKEANEALTQPTFCDVSSLRGFLEDLKTADNEKLLMADNLKKMKNAARKMAPEDAASIVPNLHELEEQFTTASKAVPTLIEDLSKILPLVENLEADKKDLEDWIKDYESLVKALKTEEDPVKAANLRKQLKRHLKDLPHQKAKLDQLKSQLAELEQLNPGNVNMDDVKEKLEDLEKALNDINKRGEEDVQETSLYETAVKKAKSGLTKVGDLLRAMEEIKNRSDLSPDQKLAKLSELERELKLVEAEVDDTLQAYKRALARASPGEKKAMKKQMDDLQRVLDDYRAQVDGLEKDLQNEKQLHDDLENEGDQLTSDVAKLQKKWKKYVPPDDAKQLNQQIEQLKELLSDIERTSTKLDENKDKATAHDIAPSVRVLDSLKSELDSLHEDALESLNEKLQSLKDLKDYQEKQKELDECLKAAKAMKQKCQSLKPTKDNVEEKEKLLEALQSKDEEAEFLLSDMRQSAEASARALSNSGKDDLRRALREAERESGAIFDSIEADQVGLVRSKKQRHEVEQELARLKAKMEVLENRWPDTLERVENPSDSVAENNQVLSNIAAIEEELRDLTGPLQRLEELLKDSGLEDGGIQEEITKLKASKTKLQRTATQSQEALHQHNNALTNYKRTEEEFLQWLESCEDRLKDCENAASDRHGVQTSLSRLKELDDVKAEGERWLKELEKLSSACEKDARPLLGHFQEFCDQLQTATAQLEEQRKHWATFDELFGSCENSLRKFESALLLAESSRHSWSSREIQKQLPALKSLLEDIQRKSGSFEECVAQAMDLSQQSADAYELKRAEQMHSQRAAVEKRCGELLKAMQDDLAHYNSLVNSQKTAEALAEDFFKCVSSLEDYGSAVPMDQLQGAERFSADVKLAMENILVNFDQVRPSMSSVDTDTIHSENQKLRALVDRAQQRLSKMKAAVEERNLQEKHALDELSEFNRNLDDLSARLKHEEKPLEDLNKKKARVEKLKVMENEFQSVLALPLRRLLDRRPALLSPETQAKIKKAELNADTLKAKLASQVKAADDESASHETLHRLMNTWRNDLTFCGEKLDALAARIGGATGTEALQDQAHFEQQRQTLSELERRWIAMKPRFEEVLETTAPSGKPDLEKKYKDMRLELEQRQEKLKQSEDKWKALRNNEESLNNLLRTTESMLKSIQRGITENSSLRGTLAEKQGVYENNQRNLEELHLVSDHLQDASLSLDRLNKLKGEVDFPFSSLLSALQSRLESAKEQCNALNSKVLQNVLDHEAMEREYKEADGWLKENEFLLRDTVAASQDRRPEQVLATIEKLEKGRSDGQRLLQQFTSQADRVALSTNPPGRVGIMNMVNSLDERWNSLLHEIQQHKSQIEEAIYRARENAESLSRASKWLQEHFKAVESLAEPIANLRDIQSRCQQERALEDAIKEYGPTVDRLIHRLSPMDPNQATAAESLRANYHKLNDRLMDSKTSLESQLRDHLKFNDQLRDFSSWLKIQRTTLASMRDVPSDLPLQEVNLNSLVKLFEEGLPTGQKRLEELYHTSKLVEPGCSEEGKNYIESECCRLEGEFTKFSGDLQEAISTQRQAIATSKAFIEACDRIKEMLRTMENSLKTSTDLYEALPAKKQALDNCTETFQELQELQAEVDLVSGKASEVMQLIPDTVIAREVANINNLYQRLLGLAREKEKLLQGNLNLHVTFSELLDDLDTFLKASTQKTNGLEATLRHSQRSSRTIELTLSQVNNLEHELDTKRGALQHVIHTAEHVKNTTSTPGIPPIQRLVDQAKRDYAELQDTLSSLRADVLHNLSRFHEFDLECDVLRTWLASSNVTWGQEPSEYLKRSLIDRRSLLVDLKAAREESERKGYDCERLQEKAAELGSSECEEVASDLHRQQQRLMTHLDNCLQAIQRSISGQEEYMKSRNALSTFLSDVQTQFNHMRDTSALNEKELLSRAATFPPLIESLQTEGEKMLNAVLKYGEQVIASRIGNANQIAQEVDSSQTDFTRLLEKMQDANTEFSHLQQIWKEYRSEVERFRNWLSGVTTRQAHTATRIADLLQSQAVFTQHQALYDEIVARRGDLDHIQELVDDLLTKWYDPAIQTQMTELSSEYDTVVSRSRDLNRRMEDLNRDYQAFQRSYRATQRWMETATQKLLQCSDCTGKPTDLEERLRIVKEISNSLDEGQSKLLTTEDFGETLMKLLTTGDGDATSENKQEKDNITAQLDTLQNNWKSLTTQVSSVMQNLEMALEHWRCYADLHDRLSKWLEEMNHSLERAESYVRASEEGDLLAHRACCERYKALKKEIERMTPDFQILQRTCDDLLSTTPNANMDRDHQELQRRFHDLATRIKMRIDALEHTDQLLTDYLKSVDDCEKWILQTRLRLLSESSAQSGDQHFACWDLNKADLHKEIMEMDIHEPVSIQTVKQLQHHLMEHRVVSEDIAAKNYSMEHVKSLGEKLLQNNHSSGLLMNPTLNVKDQLRDLQKSYDELCQADAKIEGRLEESMLHVMDQFLNGELANWWILTQPSRASSTSSISNWESGKPINIDSRQMDAERVLQKLTELWDVVKPYALKHSRGATYGLPQSHLCSLGEKLLEQTPKEVEKLKQLLSNLNKLRSGLDVYENMKSDFSDWLLGKQKEWSDCRIQMPRGGLLDSEDRENVYNDIKHLLNDLQSRQRDLDSLEQLHKTLSEGGVVPQGNDIQLSQLSDDHNAMKEGIQEALSRLAKEAHDEMMEKKRLKRLQAENELNSKYIQASASSSDADEYGLRNSGGNRGISKQFWPYSAANDPKNVNPMKSSKSVDELNKVSGSERPSSSPSKRRNQAQALKQLISTVKDLNRRHTPSLPDESYRRGDYFSQPPSPSPPASVASESVRRNGPSLTNPGRARGPSPYTAPSSYQKPILRSPYPSTGRDLPDVAPPENSAFSPLFSPPAVPGLKTASANPLYAARSSPSPWKGRSNGISPGRLQSPSLPPSSFPDPHESSRRNLYPPYNGLNPTSRSGGKDSSPLGNTGRAATSNYALRPEPYSNPYSSGAPNRSPDKESLMKSLDKAAESAQDLRKISDNLKQLAM